VHGDAENVVLDLRMREACYEAVAGAVDVYNLAADMAGSRPSPSAPDSKRATPGSSIRSPL
jgi:hypothetical protein